MKRMAALIAAAAVALATHGMARAAGHEHGGGVMDHGMQAAESGKAAHEEVVGGARVIFRIVPMAEVMQGMAMPKGVTATHHLMVELRDAKSGMPLKDGEVNVKVLGPDKSEQVKSLISMGGHFGADFTMAKRGRYGIMAKIRAQKGGVLVSKFWYEIK